jgi:hypothetical protein
MKTARAFRSTIHEDALPLGETGHSWPEVSIVSQHWRIHSGTESDVIDATQIARARARIGSMGTDVSTLSDEDIQKMVAEGERRFREEAPMTAAAAATTGAATLMAVDERVHVDLNDADLGDEPAIQGGPRVRISVPPAASQHELDVAVTA